MTEQFRVGVSYATRSIGDHDCVYKFKILSRTPKTVEVEVHGKIVRRGVKVRDDIEYFKPFGTYSMSPTIRATGRARELADRTTY